MEQADAKGLVSRRSASGVEETVMAIKVEIDRRGASVIAVIDHAAAARAAEAHHCDATTTDSGPTALPASIRADVATLWTYHQMGHQHRRAAH